MCGIAGIISEDTRTLESITEFNKAQYHRGPDGQGVWQTDGVALGHVRLAVLDLSDAGHQPFFSDDERYALTYNGEIYNYLELQSELESLGFSFKSCTDTEVLLASFIQWGEECLLKFNGMFAFAIWDKQEKSLFAARDHFGIKPFYYWQNSGSFAFASEIKALLQHPEIKAEPDDQVIYDYLMFGLADHTSRSFFKRIQQLPPAHKLTFNNGRMNLSRWWNLDRNRISDAGYDEKRETLLAKFEEAVRLRLRADVPVASLLSGGLDSTAIVCELARQLGDKSSKHQSFTAIYGDAAVDEDEYAAETCQFAGVEHIKEKLGSDSLWAEMDDLVYFQESPFQSTSIYAQWGIMKAVKEHGIKVLMDGQGADESLAGYDIYQSTFYWNFLKKARLGAAGSYFKEIKKYNPGASRLRFMAQAMHTGLYKKSYMDNIYKLTGQLNAGLLSKEFKGRISYQPFHQQYYKDGVKDHLYQMLFLSNLPALLRYEDRNSMAFSIESRPVFLDHQFVELVFSFQNEDLHREGYSKFIFRDAVKGKMPETVRTRRDKMGFPTPERKWVTEEKSRILDIFNSTEFKSRGYFDQQSVLFGFERYCNGMKVNKFPFWRAINLELWFRKFVD